MNEIDPECQRLIARFDAEMKEIYFRAKREAGYKATYFRQMVKEMGGIAAAHQLLAAGPVSFGYTELILAGRPDLTVEALALRSDYAVLFSAEELSRATERTPTEGSLKWLSPVHRRDGYFGLTKPCSNSSEGQLTW